MKNKNINPKDNILLWRSFMTKIISIFSKNTETLEDTSKRVLLRPVLNQYILFISTMMLSWLGILKIYDYLCETWPFIGYCFGLTVWGSFVYIGFRLLSSLKIREQNARSIHDEITKENLDKKQQQGIEIPDNLDDNSIILNASNDSSSLSFTV